MPLPPQHGSSLDEIRTSSGSYTAALENHGASLEGINSLSVTPAAKDSNHHLRLALEDIRSPGIPPVPAADAGNLAALETQVGYIISTLNTHSAAWNEIKERSASETPVSKEIVSIPDDAESPAEGPFATVIETFMLHTNLLNEIKEVVSAEILTVLHDMGQAQVNHTNLLTEIREGDVSDEILTPLHASGESHAAHGAVLDEIKYQSLEPAAPAAGPNLGGLEEQINGIVTKLDDHSAHLAVIKDATTASNDSHVAHAAILGEIKDAALASNESHTAHASTLAEIKDATSALNDNHSTHAATLSEIKDATLASNNAHASHIAAFTELKSIQPSPRNPHDHHPQHPRRSNCDFVRKKIGKSRGHSRNRKVSRAFVNQS